ncbi:hypothetical protein, partial [Shewanella algae]|uniref:hypothetical protein n=1 Tax=Shewanella algae TaxID=38313 RepID=UPI00313FC36E
NAELGAAHAAAIGASFHPVNVTDEAAVDNAIAEAEAVNGKARILVNCAGTGNAIKTVSRSKEDGSVKHFPLDAFDR